tara:strand:+ start:33967 stop:35220 length:1254 start_codon:yes stop_codon:yes gene_type:complete
MFNLLKENKLTRSFWFSLICITFLSCLIGQEKKFNLILTEQSNNTEFWWLQKNSFGNEISGTILSSTFSAKGNNNNIIIKLLSDNNYNTYLHESFIKFKFKNNTFLKIGRYYRDFSLYLNDEISSGSLLISNNAIPMPKISFLTKKKIDRNPAIFFDFGLSHAEFDKNSIYLSSPYLHEKFIYINVKKNNYQYGIGLVHEAMWGGNILGNGPQPQKFEDFLKVLISADGKPINNEEHSNALGNHLGIWDFYIQIKKTDISIKAYYQHFFEDTSGLRFANRWDGLWGIELKNNLNNNIILFEYLDTSNQYIDPPYVADAYYNHNIYKAGWSYKGNVIGNPFIDSLTVNPVKVLHIGSEGSIFDKYFYSLKLSRKINTSDYIKYKIAFDRKVDEKNSVGIFIANSKTTIIFGLSIEKVF